MALSFVFLAIDDLPYFYSEFGEMAYLAPFYSLFAALLFWILKLAYDGRIFLPTTLSAKLFVFFIIWILLSGALNLYDVTGIEVKGRLGIEKLIFQLIVVLFGFIVAIFIYNVLILTREPLVTIRRLILISFLLVGSYSILELFYLAGNEQASIVLEKLNMFIHASKNIENYSYLYPNRVRSVSSESSWFSMYSGFAFPWIVSYMFTRPKNYIIYLFLTSYFLILIMFTFSRTALVITFCQLSLIIYALIREKVRKLKLLFYMAISILILIGFAYTSNIGNLAFTVNDLVTRIISLDAPSNLARFGSQVAALEMGMENPLFGVGLGQYGFHMSEFVPEWAKASSEIRLWTNPAVGTAWPPIHSIYVRLICEVGLIGFLIWCLAWFNLIYSCYKTLKLSSIYMIDDRELHFLSISLLVSMVGVFLAGFNSDSFRFLGYWYVMGIGWSYNYLTQVDIKRTLELKLS
ncbi:MAG: O-antigen ligase family protein [Nitrospirae bacterium]|nr:O-antigen ligase family protein [Nitrospirota bacterium]